MTELSPTLGKMLWLFNSSDALELEHSRVLSDICIMLEKEIVDVTWVDESGVRNLTFPFDSLENGVSDGKSYSLKSDAGKQIKVKFYSFEETH